MNREKNYFWIPPLLGGVLSLIALLTPATYINIYEFDYQIDFYVWMWGLGSMRSYYAYEDSSYTNTQFTDNINLLIPSIICSILVFIFAVFLIGSANSIRTGKKEFFKSRKGFYAVSVLLIITTAVWMIVYEVVSYIEVSQSWWDVMDPGFGVIGIFLGATISIIGIAIANYLISQKQRMQIHYIEKQQYTIPQSSNQGSYKTQQMSVPKFCPLCGSKVLISDSKFCMECGFEFGKRI